MLESSNNNAEKDGQMLHIFLLVSCNVCLCPRTDSHMVGPIGLKLCMPLRTPKDGFKPKFLFCEMEELAFC